MNLKEQDKLENIKQSCKKSCKFCGHTMSFYAFEKNTKVCNWCGKLNYRNEFIEFRELFIKKRKELES